MIWSYDQNGDWSICTCSIYPFYLPHFGANDGWMETGKCARSIHTKHNTVCHDNNQPTKQLHVSVQDCRCHSSGNPGFCLLHSKNKKKSESEPPSQRLCLIKSHHPTLPRSPQPWHDHQDTMTHLPTTAWSTPLPLQHYCMSHPLHLTPVWPTPPLHDPLHPWITASLSVDNKM